MFSRYGRGLMMPLHSLLFVITFFACLLINSGHANYLAHSKTAYVENFWTATILHISIILNIHWTAIISLSLIPRLIRLNCSAVVLIQNREPNYKLTTVKLHFQHKLGRYWSKSFLISMPIIYCCPLI